MTAATVALVTAPARLDALVTRMCGDEPSINDVAGVLQMLGTNEVDPMRAQALVFLAARALGKFDAYTRHAPPSGLRDLVAESLQPCAAYPTNGCGEDVAPWDGVTCGSVECDRAYARAIGEVR